MGLFGSRKRKPDSVQMSISALNGTDTQVVVDGHKYGIVERQGGKGEERLLVESGLSERQKAEALIALMCVLENEGEAEVAAAISEFRRHEHNLAEPDKQTQHLQFTLQFLGRAVRKKRMHKAVARLDQHLSSRGQRGIFAVSDAIRQAIKERRILVGHDKIFEMTRFPGFVVHEGTWLINDGIDVHGMAQSLIGAACTHLDVPEDLFIPVMRHYLAER